MPLPAPTNVTAAVTFDGNDAPVVTLIVSPVTGASAYRFSRDPVEGDRFGGVTLGQRSTSTTLEDSVAANPNSPPQADTTYFYRVYAEDGSGVDGYRMIQPVQVDIPAAPPDAPDEDPDPPDPPAPGPYLLPPANLRAGNYLTINAWTRQETIEWDAVTNAVSYEVYNVEGMTLIGVVAAPNRQMVLSQASLAALTSVAVVSVDSSGNRSIPSDRHTFLGAFNDFSTHTFSAPYALQVVPLWNNGVPIMWLRFKTNERHAEVFRIYRNGQLIASGVGRTEYVDMNVVAGQAYSYEVESIRWNGTAIAVGTRSASVSGTARTAQPAALLNPFTATVLSRATNSCIIRCTDLTAQGAVDYRTFPNAAQPYEGDKYCGEGPGPTDIQINGLGNGSGNAVTYKVQALDKLGPYQQGHEFHNAPGMANATPILHVNGQGPAVFVPNVLAETTVSVYGTARTLTGTGGFLDLDSYSHDFGLTSATLDQSLIDAHNSIGLSSITSDPAKLPLLLKKQGNSKFWVYFIRSNMNASRVFFKGGHPMSAHADGGTPGIPIPLHNFNASLIIEPKTRVAIGSTDVLHVFWEVDGHFGLNARRWVKTIIADSTDNWWLPDEEFGVVPVQSGKYILAETFGDHNRVKWNSGPGPGLGGEQTAAGPRGGRGEGGQRNLDLRVGYDLYFRRSDGRLVFFEDGVRVIDRTITVPGMAYTALRVGFISQVYHTQLDYQSEQGDRNSVNQYFINRARYSDMRHWRDMGFQVNPSGGIP